MADIAFLLIIFFMLTAVFASIKGLDFGLPNQDPNQVVNVKLEEALYVKVQGRDNYLLNGQPIQVEQLGPAIKSQIDQNSNTPVIIDTLPDAPFEAMIIAFDEARLAGATRITLPTAEDRQQWERLGVGRK
jgi:biopolymer transport protein ExbD